MPLQAGDAHTAADLLAADSRSESWTAGPRFIVMDVGRYLAEAIGKG